MEFTCSRQEINEIINIVQRAVSVKSTMPILECIKIDCDAKGTVIFSGNNGDIYIEYKDEMHVTEGGTVALGSKIFGEIVRKLPDGEVKISVNEETNVAKIKCGISEFNIEGLVEDEFPQPPKFEAKSKFTVNEKVLGDMIKKTVNFAATGEAKRHFLTGVFFNVSGENLTVVATDSHRLAWIKNDLVGEADNCKFIVPSQTLRELIKIIGEKDQLIKISINENMAIFEFEKFKFYSRLIEGEYIKYEYLLSVKNNRIVKVKNSEMKNALERALLLINDDSSTSSKVPVRLNFNFNKICVTCMTSKGKVNDEIDAHIEGEEILIGLNCKFLLDALNSCEDEEIVLEMSSPLSACYIKSAEKDNFLFFILPIRLYN